MKTLKKSRPELGRRELSKLERLQRIRAAARESFSKRGYDAATLRQIAKRAHVGLGTLFNYAHDKRDLVFLIVNEEFAALTDAALKAPQPHQPLIDQLIAIIRHRYEFFARNPVLSRIFLKELVFYAEGKHVPVFHAIRGRLLAGIEDLVRAAQKEKRLRSTEDASVIARSIYFVYTAAIRWWIAKPNPDPLEGLADLRRLLNLQILEPLPLRKNLRKSTEPRRSHRRVFRGNDGFSGFFSGVTPAHGVDSKQ